MGSGGGAGNEDVPCFRSVSTRPITPQSGGIVGGAVGPQYDRGVGGLTGRRGGGVGGGVPDTKPVGPDPQRFPSVVPLYTLDPVVMSRWGGGLGAARRTDWVGG